MLTKSILAPITLLFSRSYIDLKNTIEPGDEWDSPLCQCVNFFNNKNKPLIFNKLLTPQKK